MNAAVLAGGKGSRMEYADKASLLYKGRTFLEIIAGKLSPFDRTLVVTNRDSKSYGNIKADFRSDLVNNIGPMGGIYTALNWSDSDLLFITTCDMPFIEREQIDLVCNAGDYDVVVPSFEGKYEMLFARYSRRCLPQFEKLIGEKRYKITGIFEDESLKVRFLPVDSLFIHRLRNINTTEEYKSL